MGRRKEFTSNFRVLVFVHTKVQDFILDFGLSYWHRIYVQAVDEQFGQKWAMFGII